MNTHAAKALCLGLAMMACLSVSPAHAIAIDWVAVGNAGNAADTTGYGAVAADYRIMKYEWTNSQYTAFLNAVDPDGSNPNGVYNASMGSEPRGGISFSSLAGIGSKYSVRTNMGDKPVSYVSWWDTARVSNWLHNGTQTYGSTDSSASAPQNTGAYEVGTATTGASVAKNPGARYWLPTENEWYKAAFYTGVGTTYRTFANGFDTNPATVSADVNGNGSAGGTGNSANFNFAADWNGQNGNVTTIGTNGGASHYGLHDMNGNVWEWNDLDGSGGLVRGIRGGSLGSTVDFLESFHRDLDVTTIENDNGGFRLVPEPSTCLMGVLGLAYGGYSMWRRRTCSSKVTSPRALMSLVYVMACVAATSTPAVTYDMVTVGDAGNGHDSTGYGAVPYEYQMGKYEVTIGQYAAFLNAVAKTDTYSLYAWQMGTGVNGGISRSGSSGSYTYDVIGPVGIHVPAGADSPGNRPISNVNWWNAARFANWMSNGQPQGLQQETTTENGAYPLFGIGAHHAAPGINSSNPNTGAVPLYRIPTENEWYKAAYYSPLLNSGSGGYFRYPTQSNIAPGNVIGGVTNQANFWNEVYSVTQESRKSTSQNYLTNVGAFTASASYYGTFDQGGNLEEWNDLDGGGAEILGQRGGHWDGTAYGMAADFRWGNPAQATNDYHGFRLSSPLPAVSVLTIFVASGTATQAQVGYPLLSGTIPVVKTGAGMLILNEANTLVATTTIQAGRIQLANGEALGGSLVVPVAGGMLALTPGLQTTVGGLSPNAGGLVDVGTGMISVASGLSATNLVAAILSGRADGAWDGSSGITSSVAAASGGDRTVGWLDNGDGTVTFAFAAAGDTNLDWRVDILDAANFLSGGKFDSGTPASWNEGDFTYDGVVDILDAASFLSNGLFDAGAYNPPPGQATIAVPEPSISALALVGVACGGFSLWQRRTRA